MKTRLRSLISASLLLIVLSPALYGQLYRVETPNLYLIYTGRAQQYLTPHVVGCFERSMAFHRRQSAQMPLSQNCHCCR